MKAKSGVITTLESSRIARTMEEWESLYRGIPIGLPHQLNREIAEKAINLRMQEIAIVSGSHCRSETQMRAVRRLHQKIPFTHWCSNPFEVEVEGDKFRCRFAHMFYAGTHLYVAQVFPNGRVRYAAVPTATDAAFHWESLK